jgi:hypothetical protein
MFGPKIPLRVSPRFGILEITSEKSSFPVISEIQFRPCGENIENPDAEPEEY